MNFTVYTAAATEPLTVAEVKAYARIDGANAEPAPGAPTAALISPAVAGNVDNGVHRYLATFVTADGETEAGTVSSVVTVVDKTVNGKVSLTAIPTGGTLVTSRKIYRTAAGGSTYMLLATLADNTTTIYTDNTADSGLGAGAPSTNTTTDPLLNLLIASARAAAEIEVRRFLVTQTIDAKLDGFPGDEEEIRLPPLQSVSAITYVDGNGTTQTLASSLYNVDSSSKPARITPSYGNTWPVTREQVNAVTIRFVAGYGAAAAVPQCIKQWMLLQLETAWNNRDRLAAGGNGLVPMPSTYVDSILDPERVHGRL